MKQIGIPEFLSVLIVVGQSLCAHISDLQEKFQFFLNRDVCAKKM